MADVNSRDQGMKTNTTPTGRVVGLVPVSKQSSFVRIAYIDGKGGNIPDKYAGVFTGMSPARQALMAFVDETWDVAEQHTKKRVA